MAAAPETKKACSHCSTAAPKFGDLGKKYKDLANDDFGFGAVKLTLKSKSANGTNLKAEETLNADKSVSTLLEVKYTDAAHGLTLKETWDNKFVIDTELSLENKPIKGSKFTVNTQCNTPAAWLSTLKFKAEYADEKVNVSQAVNSADATTTAVLNLGHIKLGGSGTFDLASKKLKSHSVAVNACHNNYTLNAAVNNGADVVTSVVHSNKGSHTGAEVGFKLASKDVSVNLVHKHTIDADSFVKASLNKSLLVGLAWTQKVASGVNLTLASQFNAANLAADSHKIGASLTFEH